MRKISVVLVSAMLLSVVNVVANEGSSIDPSKSMSAQISQLLADKYLNQNEVELFAQVRFTLNNEHEIVVLSVDTENPALERFVKQRLNYKKVQLDAYKEGKIYTVPVRVVN